jgi:hypothetical protein
MLAAISLGCLLLASAPAKTAKEVLAHVSLTADDYGELIYRGTAWPLRGNRAQPRFVYERRVLGMRSASIARDEAGVVLIDVADHSPSYALEQFTQYQFQVGEVRQVRVRDGEVELSVTCADGVRTAAEHTNLPVVVAPTFYGFVAQHWPRLLDGHTVAFRYAVPERLETIGFEVSRVEAPAGLVRIRMKASSPLIALFVAPIFIDYAQDGALVAYEGRVPMKTPAAAGWNDFDAHVEYEHFTPSFR